MILLDKVIINRRSLVSIDVKICEHYKTIIELVKKQPIRVWARKIKKYSIPFNGIGRFLNLLRKNDIVVTVIWDVELVKSYMNWKRYVTKQLTIKKYSIEKNINCYNKLVKTENKLRPYQTIGAHFLFSGKNSLLADKVGIGKTPQSIIAAERLLVEKDYFMVLVIVPSALKDKWSNDVCKFLGENRNIVINGIKNKRKLLYKEGFKKNNFLITSYELARYDYEDFLLPLLYEYKNKNKKIVLIYDEIQFLKNIETVRFELCKRISKYCKRIYGLSATFFETTIMDVFNIMYILDFTVLGDNHLRFWNRHVVLDYFGNVSKTKCKRLKEVSKKINHIKIRRHKEQVFKQLPDRQDVTYWCGLSSKQEKLYKNILNEIRKELEDSRISNFNALSKLIYLQQCCLSSELIDNKDKSSSKLSLLFEILESIGNEKVVIFSHFLDMIKIIKREMEKKHYNKIKIIDSLTKNRQKFVDEFNYGNSINYVILSDALKAGIDLIGSSISINYDLLWNPASMEQRNGRIDRFNQESNKLTIINLVTEGTVEQVMHEVVIGRKELDKEVSDEGYISKRINYKNILYKLVEGDD